MSTVSGCCCWKGLRLGLIQDQQALYRFLVLIALLVLEPVAHGLGVVALIKLGLEIGKRFLVLQGLVP